jgi:hypothetical protein
MIRIQHVLAAGGKSARGFSFHGAKIFLRNENFP